MDGECQDEFVHCTSPSLVGERMTVTFRWVKRHGSGSLAAVVVSGLPTCHLPFRLWPGFVGRSILFEGLVLALLWGTRCWCAGHKFSGSRWEWRVELRRRTRSLSGSRCLFLTCCFCGFAGVSYRPRGGIANRTTSDCWKTSHISACWSQPRLLGSDACVQFFISGGTLWMYRAKIVRPCHPSCSFSGVFL